jgi:DNA-binding transcriptional ArsR family regulator
MVTHPDCKLPKESLGPLLKAISHPKRRQMLDLLARDDLPVARIAEQFSISRTAVVKHLRVLRAVHLVSARRRGRERIQSLNAQPLKSVNEWVSRFEPQWGDDLPPVQLKAEPSLGEFAKQHSD